VVSDVAAQGYAAKIFPRQRSRAQYWFDLSGAGTNRYWHFEIMDMMF